MTSKNIILAGMAAIGIYLFSQAKKIPFITEAQRSPSAATQTIRQRTAQKISQRIAQKVAQKVAPVNIYEYMRERARMHKAIPIRSKKIARKIPSVGTPAARRRMAQKIEETRNRKMREQMVVEQRAVVAREAAVRKAAAQKKAAAHKAAVRKATAQKIGKKIGKTAAQKIFQNLKTRRAVMAWYAKRQRPQIQRPNTNKKQVASWKAPYRFPKLKFRVITPTDKLRNLAKKDIARKKAEQQKAAQKTTSSTLSARRKKRLEALYGQHWHQVWIQRQKRR